MRSAIAALTLFASTALGAQGSPSSDAQKHQGFWIGFTAGVGTTHIECKSNCGAATLPQAWQSGTGSAFTFALGGTPRQNLLLGGEFGVVSRTASSSESSMGWASFIAQYYPRARSGLFLRGGVGIGLAMLEAPPLGVTGVYGVTGGGPSLEGGIGYDFRFGGKFGLAPMVQYVQAFGPGQETTVSNRRYVGPESPGAFLVGLGFHWY